MFLVARGFVMQFTTHATVDHMSKLIMNARLVSRQTHEACHMSRVHSRSLTQSNSNPVDPYYEPLSRFIITQALVFCLIYTCSLLGAVCLRHHVYISGKVLMPML